MIYYRMENNTKKYTLSHENSESAIPAKYSTEDKFSEERIEMKRRYKIFPFDN